MTENTENKPRVMLVSVDIGEYDTERSIDELTALCDTAGADVEAVVTQKRPSYDNATCIGSGRLEEMAQLCESLEIDRIIFDCELSATQIRNIEDATDTTTIDRTMLILDIFAQRAVTREGKIQVELALDAVAAAESIEISDEEKEAEYNRLAEQYGMKVEQVKAAVAESDLVNELKTKKAAEVVYSNGKAGEAKKAEAEAEGEEKPKKKAAPRKKAAKKAEAEEPKAEGEEPKTEE